MGLFSNKAPTAKFKQIGDEVEGVIVAFDKQQRTEFIPGGIGGPMFWHKGKPTADLAADPVTGKANDPVMDDVIILDTGVADEYGETERRLFIKGKQMLADLEAACRAGGVRDVDLGGRLACRWATGAGGTADPRVYAFRYTPPGAAAPAPAPASDGLQERQREAVARVQRAQTNNTAKRDAAKAAPATTTRQALGIQDDDEPPF